jgi:hypothetical protein
MKTQTQIRWPLRVAVPAAVLAVAALALADVPHTFATGDTLQAADLNTNFTALDQRLATLEARDPTGSFPAVVGRGEHPLGSGTAPTWFCGTAPPSLEVSPAPIVPGAPVTFSYAFGTLLFTSGGAVSLNLDPATTNPGPPTGPCPSSEVCAEPLTFFLTSPRAQTITLHTYLDNLGSIYVNGTLAVGNIGGNSPPSTSNIAVPAGPFSLSIMACSNDGPTIAFVIYDAFLTNPAYGLTVDYDATFHRNGK